MSLYHPDLSQKFGTFVGTVIGVWMSWGPLIQTAMSAAVGATVAFIVTTILRYVWEGIKKKYNLRR